MTCHMCKRDFVHLQQHIRDIHDPVYYPCPHCVKSFYRKGNLKEHIKKVHCEERTIKEAKDVEKRKLYKYVCKECGKRFKLLHQLKNHIDGMHSENYYQCPHCVERFTWWSSYCGHINLEHGPLVLRRRCGEGRKLLKYVKENSLSLAVLQEEDRKNIDLYKQYIEKHRRKYTE